MAIENGVKHRPEFGDLAVHHRPAIQVRLARISDMGHRVLQPLLPPPKPTAQGFHPVGAIQNAPVA